MYVQVLFYDSLAGSSLGMGEVGEEDADSVWLYGWGCAGSHHADHVAGM